MGWQHTTVLGYHQHSIFISCNNSNCLVGLGGLGVLGNTVAPTLPGVPGVGILGMVTGQTPLQGKLILP